MIPSDESNAARVPLSLPAGVRNIVLTGFMGSGKSTVARRLAQRLGWAFLDTDHELERRAGKPVARIFKEEGEAAFRALEAGLARELAWLRGRVIATGGGMAVPEENRRALARAGALVLLEATPETIWQRVRHARHRPLLDHPDPRAEIERLMAARADAYGRIRLKVPIEGGTPDSIAEAVLRAIEEDRRGRAALHVDLGERSYPIEIGQGWVEKLGEALEPFFPPRKCLLVTNPEIGKRWAPVVIEGLESYGYQVETLEIPEGETHKTQATVSLIHDKLVGGKYTRQSGVITLGGGVAGDITGYAAATFLRGVAYIQLPTTLLAMVDSSVGGKTGVNHPLGKNLIGAFWQPTFVGVELGFLETLPLEELRSGLAEIIKYGVIEETARVGFREIEAPKPAVPAHEAAARVEREAAGHEHAGHERAEPARVGDEHVTPKPARARPAPSELFQYLEANIEGALARDPQVLAHLVTRSCQIKAEVVAQDEHENGLRAILNYGHTFGHAAEALSHYSAIRHGEGVAMGMVAAARMAAARGLVTNEYAARLEALIARAGLPTRMLDFEPAAYWNAMASDKKVRDGKIRFVLPLGEGEVQIFDDVTREEVFACLGGG